MRDILTLDRIQIHKQHVLQLYKKIKDSEQTYICDNKHFTVFLFYNLTCANVKQCQKDVKVVVYKYI